MASASPTEAGDRSTKTDGRRARRERGRLAAIDAAIDLVFETGGVITAEQVAARAGVSVASMFRYFDTLDDMRRETVSRYFDRYAHLFEIPNIGEGPLADRIAAYVASSDELYATTEPMSRLSRARAFDVEILSDGVARLRATRADQIRHHFDAELSSLTPASRDDLVAVVNALTSFESWEQLRHDHQRTSVQIRRAWGSALAALFAGSR